MKIDKIEIRRSTIDDLPQIMSIYSAARLFMREHGNPTQWSGGYPSRDIIAADITAGVSYVGCIGGTPAFVFSLIDGEDPTYTAIENGRWLNTLPYSTIHRLASDGSIRGALRMCVDFCMATCDNIRVDTHAYNSPMISGLLRLGFKQCGIIHLADGSPRIAFQLCVSQQQ